MSLKILRLLLTFVAAALLTIPPARAADPDPKTFTPEAQAAKMYRALRDQDFEGMFNLLAFTAKAKAGMTSAKAFADGVVKGYDAGFKTLAEKQRADKVFKSVKEITVGAAKITGTRAVVTTSAKITVNGVEYRFHGVANLIQDEGVWKIDLTSDENTDKAIAQRIAEIMGKPE